MRGAQTVEEWILGMEARCKWADEGRHRSRILGVLLVGS